MTTVRSVCSCQEKQVTSAERPCTACMKPFEFTAVWQRTLYIWLFVRFRCHSEFVLNTYIWLPYLWASERCCPFGYRRAQEIRCKSFNYPCSLQYGLHEPCLCYFVHRKCVVLSIFKHINSQWFLQPKYGWFYECNFGKFHGVPWPTNWNSGSFYL
jgi:hypothetical protein